MTANHPILIVGISAVDAVARPVDQVPAPGGLRFFDELTLASGGCAVNCAIALSRLGVGCDLIACVGADLFGDFLLAELARNGVPTDGVIRCAGVHSPFTFAAVRSDGERRFFHTAGANARLCREHVPAARLCDRKFVFVTGVMLLDGLDGAPAAALLADARASGARTLLDTVFVESASQEEWRARVAPALPQLDYFIPSLPEARALSGLDEPGQIARWCQERGAASVVIKLGAEGAFLREAGGREAHVPALRVANVVDSTGAGDCWAAGFLAALSRGAEFEPAVRLGHAVAAQAIQSVGATTGVPTLERASAMLREAENRSG